MGRLTRIVKHKLIYVCIFISFVLIIYTVFKKDNWETRLKIPNNKAANFDEELTIPFWRESEPFIYNKDNGANNNQNNVMFLFNEAINNKQLQHNFKTCITSLLSKYSNTSTPLKLHVTGDTESLYIAYRIIQNIMNIEHTPFQVAYHDKVEVLSSVSETIANIHAQLSTKAHHFSDPVFYISLVVHRIMPADVTRLIILDVDLIFMSDITDLFHLFSNFTADQAIGIARENQPVYRNVFWDYRKRHPGTKVGEPPPDGLTGFNSGVVLFDLSKLRHSSLYNSFLAGDNLLTLVRKYEFRGHLGDQDFFTLLSFEYGLLFYILPCGWNRQLCTWWRREEFVSIFHRYYFCQEPVHIWHRNCNTSLLG